MLPHLNFTFLAQGTYDLVTITNKIKYFHMPKWASKNRAVQYLIMKTLIGLKLILV